MEIQQQSSSTLPKILQSIMNTLLECSIEIARLMRNTVVLTLDTINKFGDVQLHLDVESDHLIQKHLKTNEFVSGFLSEERPHYNVFERKQIDPNFIVTYDPLDGSSIIDTNFSIGSIFGIWKNTNSKLIDHKVGDILVSGLIVTYGPRTTAIYYNIEKKTVQEYTLIEQKWVLSEDSLIIKPIAKIFSPGNLRAINENQNYSKVVHKWIARGLTLRYTGGLVPDVNQIFLKGNGIFANISSASHKAKLRLLYQVAPIAFLIQKAGGRSVVNGHQSALDFTITGYNDRVQCIFGSRQQVEQIQYLLH